ALLLNLFEKLENIKKIKVITTNIFIIQLTKLVKINKEILNKIKFVQRIDLVDDRHNEYVVIFRTDLPGSKDLFSNELKFLRRLFEFFGVQSSKIETLHTKLSKYL